MKSNLEEEAYFSLITCFYQDIVFANEIELICL